jgi:N-acetylglucosaminyldiphosphoundecaprenol N-acetyl-beta-D-mannosaminyltransferase
MTRPAVPVREVCGVPIAAVTMTQAVDCIAEAIAARRRLQVAVVNAAKLVNMKRDPRLRDDVLSSGLVLADGMSVVWASRLLGRRLPERVTGIDLMHALLARGSELGYRVYCLGATPEVLTRTREALERAYPGVQFVGWQHGYFTAGDEALVVAHIAAARPDILLVAMTSPRKEQFIAQWTGTIGSTVCHGVGGSFDVVAGQTQRAPALWQRLGLEWLYRVKQEPRRLWRRYLVTNALFIGLVGRELGRRVLRNGLPVAGEP